MDFPVSVPGAGLVAGKFVDEDAAVGQQGSLIPAKWGNAVTEEMLTVIEAAGLEPDEENNTQLLQAVGMLIAALLPDLDQVANYPPATQAEALAGLLNTRYMTPLRSREHGDGRYATKASTQTIFVAAGGHQQRLTAGATPLVFETTTNKRTLRVLEFDHATPQYAQLGWVMPKGWDKGPVKVRFVWSATATGGVRWGAQGAALSDGDSIDAAWGAVQEVTHTIGGANQVKTSPETGNVVLDASPSDEDFVQLQVYRKADDVTNDTLGVKARLIGIRVTYGTASLNDA